MTPEQSAWAAIQPHLSGADLDPHRVENVVGPGTPDVDYAGGNIELKAVEAWPARPATPVQVPEFTGEQAGWLARRWQCGGASWLLVRTGREWFLFDGWTAMEVRKGQTQAWWRRRAVWTHHASQGWARPRAMPLLALLLRRELDCLPPCDRARLYRLTCFPRGTGQPKSINEVAADLGWEPRRLLDAEQGPGRGIDTDDLLAYWEN